MVILSEIVNDSIDYFNQTIEALTDKMDLIPVLHCWYTENDPNWIWYLSILRPPRVLHQKIQD